MSPPSTKKRGAIPYSLDAAVEDELRFWRDVRKLIHEEIQAATKDAVQSMQIVANSQKVVVQRLNRLDESFGRVSVDVSRLAGWTTRKELQDALLNQRLERLLEVLTPPMPESEPPPAAPDPTPPRGTAE